MKKFQITANEFLSISIDGFYHVPYVRMGVDGNPDYLNDLKNTFNDFKEDKLGAAAQALEEALKTDLPQILRFMGHASTVICVVPRAKAEGAYQKNQQRFRTAVQAVVLGMGDVVDGTSYICRHTNTKTTHLKHTKIRNDGNDPYPGITKDTCSISSGVRGKNILLVDDIYTPGVNIDEDAISALLDAGAKTVAFYAIGKVR